MVLERDRAAGNPSHVEDRPMKVFVRMRPFNQFELREEVERKYSLYNVASRSWKAENKKSCVQTTNTGESLPRKNGKTHFTFDRVFDENATTQDIYNESCRSLVKDLINGVSGSVILYGQTAAGKTYTMQGSGTLRDGAADTEGIIHMTMKDLFDELSTQSDGSFLLRVSVIEIYNEDIRDLLLESRSQSKVTTRYDSNFGLIIEKTEKFVTNVVDMIDVLSTADEKRVSMETEMNQNSSRSHVVFRFTLEKSIKSDGNDNPMVWKNGHSVQVSTLSLIDLAGSDATRGSTKKDNQCQKEGSIINKSLLALSHVFADLGRSRSGFINYRDSNLTKLLQTDLMSNCNVSVICCITPSGLFTEQTRKTLEFGKYALGVKARPKRKQQSHERSIIMKTWSELENLRTNAVLPDFVSERKLKDVQARWEVIEKFMFGQSHSDEGSQIKTELFDDFDDDDDDGPDFEQISSCSNKHEEDSRNLIEEEASKGDSFSKTRQKFSKMIEQWAVMKTSPLDEDMMNIAVPMEIQFHDENVELNADIMKGLENTNDLCIKYSEYSEDETLCGRQDSNSDYDLMSYSVDSCSECSNDPVVTAEKTEKNNDNHSLEDVIQTSPSPPIILTEKDISEINLDNRNSGDDLLESPFEGAAMSAVDEEYSLPKSEELIVGLSDSSGNKIVNEQNHSHMSSNTFVSQSINQMEKKTADKPQTLIHDSSIHIDIMTNGDEKLELPSKLEVSKLIDRDEEMQRVSIVTSETMTMDQMERKTNGNYQCQIAQYNGADLHEIIPSAEGKGEPLQVKTKSIDLKKATTSAVVTESKPHNVVQKEKETVEDEQAPNATQQKHTSSPHEIIPSAEGIVEYLQVTKLPNMDAKMGAFGVGSETRNRHQKEQQHVEDEQSPQITYHKDAQDGNQFIPSAVGKVEILQAKIAANTDAQIGASGVRSEAQNIDQNDPQTVVDDQPKAMHHKASNHHAIMQSFEGKMEALQATKPTIMVEQLKSITAGSEVQKSDRKQQVAISSDQPTTLHNKPSIHNDSGQSHEGKLKEYSGLQVTIPALTDHLATKHRTIRPSESHDPDLSISITTDSDDSSLHDSLGPTRAEKYFAPKLEVDERCVPHTSSFSDENEVGPTRPLNRGPTDDAITSNPISVAQVDDILHVDNIHERDSYKRATTNKLAKNNLVFANKIDAEIKAENSQIFNDDCEKSQSCDDKMEVHSVHTPRSTDQTYTRGNKENFFHTNKEFKNMKGSSPKLGILVASNKSQSSFFSDDQSYKQIGANNCDVKGSKHNNKKVSLDSINAQPTKENLSGNQIVTDIVAEEGRGVSPMPNFLTGGEEDLLHSANQGPNSKLQNSALKNVCENETEMNFKSLPIQQVDSCENYQDSFHSADLKDGSSPHGSALIRNVSNQKKIASIEQGERYLRNWELLSESYRQHCDVYNL